MHAHLPSFGRNPRGSPDFLAYPVPKACIHVLGTGVARRLGVARSTSGPKAAQALGCSLTPGLRILFGRVTCMARAASVPGPWTLGFLLLCGVCVRVRVVLGSSFGNPANPGWRLWWVCLGTGCGFAPPFPPRVCGVCGWAWVLACTPPLLAGVLGRAWLCARSAWTLPFRARVCGVGVCAWARVSAASRHSWLRCRGVCVFVCASRLVPCPSRLGVRCGAVCLGLSCSRASPLLAGVLGRVCVCVRASHVCRHSWLGCAVCACVLGLDFWLCPANPGWGVGVCLCSCVCPASTPPFLAGWCLCVWVAVSSALRFFPSLGAGARGLLCAPRPFPVTFWGGRLWRGGVRGLPLVWFVPPPPLLFFCSGCGGGGGVWFSALSCCGFVVSVAGCPGLGSLGLCPPFPSRWRCAFVFFFLPVSAPAR